jgi:2',3'-cyclic-nucleotide 2'-phosphodiesterase (5'-nucleotidase family)
VKRRLPTENLRLCVEKLRNSGLLRAFFALIRALSSRRALDPELIRGSLSEWLHGLSLFHHPAEKCSLHTLLIFHFNRAAQSMTIFHSLLCYSVCVVALFSAVGVAEAKVKDIAPNGDATVASGNATTNYGTSTSLYLQSASASNTYGDQRAWLRFDLTGQIPAGASIQSAKLRLYNFEADAQGDDLQVAVHSSADDSWVESSVTWASQPAFDATQLDSVTLDSPHEYRWYELDVTSFVQAQFSGDKVASFVVKPVTEGESQWRTFRIDSREYSTSLAPRLRLEYTGDWSPAGGFKIIHFNDIHSRMTTHDLDLPDDGPGESPAFEEVGGVARLTTKVMELKQANPDALVLDAGDVSEGNPLGDLRGNGGTIEFFQLLNSKLVALAGRGVDAVVVGNHDVRYRSMVDNMKNAATDPSNPVPFISMNIVHDGTTTPYFDPYVVVQAGGVKVGVLGYSTDDSTHLGPVSLGAQETETLLDVLEVRWSDTDPTTIDMKDWVEQLRKPVAQGGEGVDVVVLLSHIGHRRLNATNEILLGDDGDVAPPEVVVSGHWHTWSKTAWQPSNLNYNTTNVEAASYAQYVGELSLSAEGRYIHARKHPIRVSQIAPDADMLTLISNLEAEYAAAHPAPEWGLHDVVGYSADDLRLDKDKWFTLSEFPWSGDNTAGGWITDAMTWKANQLSQVVNAGGADLALQSGGGIRRDVAAGPITYLEIFETYPWQDDEMVMVTMTGQQIWDYLESHYVGSSISQGWQVTADDGIISSVLYQGSPVNLSGNYNVVISEYMYLHDDWISESGSGFDFSSLTPTYLSTNIRDSVVEYTAQFDAANPMTVSGPRYVLNTELAGGFRAVVTMTADSETQPYFEGIFVRLVEATYETLERREQYGLADLVNPDGSINPSHQFAETMLYRSHLGFLDGYLKPGDIIEIWGEGGFFSGNPQFVDQQGIFSSETEFSMQGHNPALAQPEFHPYIASFWDEFHENHLVRFRAERTGDTTVRDSLGQTITLYKEGGFYTVDLLPGQNGDVLELIGVNTERHPERRFRLREAVVVSGYPPHSEVQAIDPVRQNSSPVTLVANAEDLNGSVPTSSEVTATADAQVVEGSPTTHYGTKTYLYVQSAASGSYLDERAWLKFDLSALPAGATITSASLEMTAWKAQGGDLAVSAHASSDDSWTEGGLNWNNQPAIGSQLDTTTLTSGVTGLYTWDVTSLVQSEYAGDQTATLLLKADAEGSASAKTYAFDSKEWGTAAERPRLVVSYTGTGGSNVGTVTQVEFFYRYSSDAGSSWTTWQTAGVDATAGTWSLDFTPAVQGLYEFYSLATDSDSLVEFAPLHADAHMAYTCMLANDLDSDDDGLADTAEDANGNYILDRGETDPCNPDTDGDGLTDGLELGVDTLIADPDGAGPLVGTDPGLFVADADPASTTSPTDKDSDDDGVSDGAEDLNRNGRIDDGEYDPADPQSYPPIPEDGEVPFLPPIAYALLSLLLAGIGFAKNRRK